MLHLYCVAFLKINGTLHAVFISYSNLIYVVQNTSEKKQHIQSR
jgi:hypothetical protein